MAEELKLDIKDFNQMSEVHDDDRFMMTQAANAHFAASMTFGTFKEKVLAPIIESSRPNGMGCEIFGSIDEYNALTELDPKTMYVIIENGQITQAFLGEYPFNVGGGGGGDVGGIPIEQVYLDLEALVLELGESKQLTASYEPSDATNTTLSWTTSNRLVAKVANGLVTSVGKGECIIKVKARSGAFAESAVTVEITLVGLSFSSDNNKLVSGFTTQIEPIATPENATLSLTYTSSDTSKATVDASTGVVTPVATAGSVTINAVNKNGVRASLPMTIVPFAVSVSCQGIDKIDNSVSNIFSKWQLMKKGSPTHYKYSETIKENGVESTLQSVDWTPMPEDGIVDIELYAEFGYKYINWTFKNADASYEEVIVAPVLYKEPELVHYDFTVDVQCTPTEAQAMTAEIPFFKYGKLFCQNIRNDDNRPSVWRGCFRWCNRDLDGRTMGLSHNTDSYIAQSQSHELLRAPRRLCYTDGCGVKKVFTFDTAGTVTWDDGTVSWDKTNFRDEIYEEDIWRMKDYGGHFILHNIFPLASDPVQPKFDMDISYALQRDRNIIFNKFGYTSIHVANPDGTWYHTRPCIKDPRTLLFSGGGSCYNLDPNNIYGKPAHRVAFGDDLSNVPLAEIRNTLLIYYKFANNWFERKSWIEQRTQALVNKKYTFMNYITHACGYSTDNGNTGIQWSYTKNYFAELYDVAGAGGDDTAWICSGDEMVEYMYFQRCANIRKEITTTGCRFIVSFEIPDYLSYKTYSVVLKNLPENAIVGKSSNVPLTYFSENQKTGMINWGVSPDIMERANRYYQKYVANPTQENLDKAWYFIRQCGEVGTTLATNLPMLNEVPVLSSVTYETNQTNPDAVSITTRNSNKEFGEADCLDISENESFNNYRSFAIPFSDHKYHDMLDDSCMNNNFSIAVPAVFGESRNYHVRLRNVYGAGNVKQIAINCVRQVGVNDPYLSADVSGVYFESSVNISIDTKHVSELRYAVNGTFSPWSAVPETLNLNLLTGTNSLVLQARNNLNEQVEKSYSVENYVSEWKTILNALPGVSDGSDISKIFDDVTKSNKLGENWAKTTNVYDTNKILRFTTQNFNQGAENKVDENGNKWVRCTFRKDVVNAVSGCAYPESIITSHIRLGRASYDGLDNGINGRVAFFLRGLSAGKYAIRFFIRHLEPTRTGTGVAYVSDSDSLSAPYKTSVQFSAADYYDNKLKMLDLMFEKTNSDTIFFGMDARFDLFGNDATDRRYGWNVVEIIKVQE